MKKARFVKSGAPRIKQAPVNMRKEEHQFVIDGYLVNEVLSQLPPTIKILGAAVLAYSSAPKHKVVVPNTLRKLGIGVIYERSSIKEIKFSFDANSPEAIRRCVKEGCVKLNIDAAKAYFGYLLLSNGKGNVMFRHCTKEIRPDETDQRKKLRVLGATEGQGQVQSVISDLNAKKYRCVIKEEPVKFVMCYKD